MPSVESGLLITKVVNAELVAERHERLAQSALELFLTKGFHKTSIREIAEAAGWQMGTLYLYISQKEDVLFLILRAIMADLTDGLFNIQQRDSARDTLKDAIEYLFRAADKREGELKLMYRESRSLLTEHLEELKRAELRDREFYCEIIRRGIEQGEFRNVRPDLFAHNIVVLAHGWALKNWALDGVTLDDYVTFQTRAVFAQLETTPVLLSA